MKIFAAVLALVLIAGSQGSPLLQAKAQTKWEEALERFWSFTTRMSHSTQEVMNKIQSTELDKQFQGLITNCMAELNVSADDLRSKLGPYTERFNADVAQLQERLNRDLTSVQSMLMIYNEEAHLMVEQNANDVRQTLALYLRKYRKRVNRDREEIKRKFHEYKDELATKGQRSLDELREMMEPYARAVGDKLQERFADIHQTLSQQAEEVRSRAEDLQGQVAENTEGLRVALTRRMEEIRTWFETEAQQVSERFTELFDSLRQQEVPAESL